MDIESKESVPDDNTERLEDTEKGISTGTGSVSPDKIHSVISISELKRDLYMYDILSIIGKGTSGIVYKAVHIKLGRKVAIKMLKPEYFKNQTILESFRKEAQILSRIKHENVASVYDFLEVNNRFYLVMELVDGKNLSDLCKKERLEENIILKIMLGLLEGARFTHNKNILHLDLKPSNILLNEYFEPIIIDFGISRFKSQQGLIEDDSLIAGTPFYMSPEQYVRSVQIDQRSDIYSLGVIFYQLLTGDLPFAGQNFNDVRNKVVMENIKRPSLINPKISLDLEAIILKMLRKNPVHRYSDAQSVIDDIKRYQKGEPVKAQKYDLMFLLWNWIRRNPLISGLAFLVLFVCLFFFGYYTYKKHQETPHWKNVFTENFNDEFKNRWIGYSGIFEGFLVPVKADMFNKYFNNRIEVASFKKDTDLVLTTSETFDENVRLSFTLTINPEPSAVFGFFVNATIPEPELGYIICIKYNEIQLLRDNLSSTPLWTGKYVFKNDQTYHIEYQVVDGEIILSINKEKLLDFYDIITWFSKKEYRFGFFAKSCDLEIDNINLYQQNTALLTTPLNIGNRFFQIGRFDDAIDEYTRVISKYPENKIAREAYYLRGLAKQKNCSFIESIKDFDKLLTLSTEISLKGKSLYQKGICQLYLGELNNACLSFDEAMTIYNITSLRSNVIDTLLTFCREKIKKNDGRAMADVELLLKYLLKLNIPSRITFVDIPKNIVLYYFDHEEFEKSINNLDLIINYYQSRRDLVAFALWKKGRAYMELAGIDKNTTINEKYLKKAIYWFKQVLIQCPEVKFYNYYSNEELAKAYRAMGDFKIANEYEKQKSQFQDIFN
jgi:serine/threonine protein kinase/tetratricopeptide (TPR) repeat protein